MAELKYSASIYDLIDNIEDFVKTIRPNPVFFALNKNKGIRGECRKCFDTAEAIEYNLQKEFNIYFQLHEYAVRRWEQIRKEEYLEKVNGFFVDIDIKQNIVTTPTALSEKLADCPIKPHFIVYTAGWWHLHFLTEPIPYKENVSFILSVQEYLNKILGGDTAFPYKTGFMKVPYLTDIFKDKEIITSNVEKGKSKPKYKFSEIRQIFTKAKLPDFELKTFEAIDKPRNMESIDSINDIEITDVIPTLFDYLNEIGLRHRFTFEGGHVHENGVPLKDAKINIIGNTFHDFSPTKYEFSGKPSFFIPNFIKHVIKTGWYNRNEHAVRTAFLWDVYNIRAASLGKGISIPKEQFMAYHDNVFLPTIEMKKKIMSGGKIMVDTSKFDDMPLTDIERNSLVLNEVMRAIRTEVNPNTPDGQKYMNAYICNAGGSPRSVVKTMLQILNVCNDHNIIGAEDIQISELFSQYYSPISFKNKAFINTLLWDIKKLSLISMTIRNRSGKLQGIPFIEYAVDPNDEEKISFQLFPGADLGAIQNRIKYSIPLKLIEISTNNHAFYDFAWAVHTELFINKKDSISRDKLADALWLTKTKDGVTLPLDKDWKRAVEKNLNLYISWIGKKITYKYARGSQEFVFTKY